MGSLLGQQFGTYRAVRLLGRGTFGEVYLGEHSSMQSLAAIKVLTDEVLTSASELFLPEARILGRLSHPHIIRLIDVGISEHRPYLLMDYASGGSLRQVHPRGSRLPNALLVFYVKQIASALSYAHSRAVIHRDLKPSNLLLSEHGEVLLSDFGLARFTQSTDYLSGQGIKGTAVYMAPEQIRGQAGKESDQYALAILVYEWITGQVPYTGTFTEVCSQHLFADPPSLPSLAASLSEAAQEVILRALSKDPTRRYPSCLDFALHLEEAALDKHSSVSFSPLPPSSLLQEAPSLSSSVSMSRSLPTQLTSLVGRTPESQQIASLLQQPDGRLLTLTGPGGVGKTRLALFVAQEVGQLFADGVTVVSLASVRDPALLLPTIAHTLGLREQGNVSAFSQLVASLQDMHWLLVLDNLEHLLEGCGELVQLLISCPRVTLLVTSREILHLEGEHSFAVSPLEVPVLSSSLLEEADATLAQYTANPAVQLFVERARMASPDFCVTESNVASVAQICARLDGLPLALELAASRIKLLSPNQLLARLESPLQLLTGGSRNLHVRQRTLRQTIAWSYSLLTPEEQRLFRRICIFAGGCTLEGIEAVTQALEDDPTTVLDEVTSLLEKSLIRRTESVDRQVRLLLLETIRSFGLEQLEAERERGPVERAHAQYYAQFSHEVQVAGKHARQQYWFRRLEAEVDNLRAMRDWWLDHDLEQAFEVDQNLNYFWWARSSLAEDTLWLTQLIERCPPGSEQVKARALVLCADNMQVLGDYRRAEELGESGWQICRELFDTETMETASFVLGTARMMRGNYQGATTILEAGLHLTQESGNQGQQAVQLIRLSEVACHLGHYQRADPLAQQALSLSEGVGDTITSIYCLGLLAEIAYAQEQFSRAAQFLEGGERKLREIEDKENQSILLRLRAQQGMREQGEVQQARTLLLQSVRAALSGGYQKEASQAALQLGYLSVQFSELEQARHWFLECKQLASSMDWKKQQLAARMGLMQVCLREGDHSQAQSLLQECRELILALPDAISYLEGMGQLRASRSNPQEAAFLWGVASALRKELDWPSSPLSETDSSSDRLLTRARVQAGAEVWKHAWSSGEQASRTRGNQSQQEPSALVEWVLLCSQQTRSNEEPPLVQSVGKRHEGLPAAALALGLTRRELDVLRLLAEGLSNAQIAEALVLSRVTVNSYLRSIYSKLAVSSRTAAVRCALDHQLI